MAANDDDESTAVIVGVLAGIALAVVAVVYAGKATKTPVAPKAPAVEVVEIARRARAAGQGFSPWATQGCPTPTWRSSPDNAGAGCQFACHRPVVRLSRSFRRRHAERRTCSGTRAFHYAMRWLRAVCRRPLVAQAESTGWQRQPGRRPSRRNPRSVAGLPVGATRRGSPSLGMAATMPCDSSLSPGRNLTAVPIWLATGFRTGTGSRLRR